MPFILWLFWTEKLFCFQFKSRKLCFRLICFQWIVVKKISLACVILLKSNSTVVAYRLTNLVKTLINAAHIERTHSVLAQCLWIYPLDLNASNIWGTGCFSLFLNEIKLKQTGFQIFSNQLNEGKIEKFPTFIRRLTGFVQRSDRNGRNVKHSVWHLITICKIFIYVNLEITWYEPNKYTYNLENNL